MNGNVFPSGSSESVVLKAATVAARSDGGRPSIKAWKLAFPMLMDERFVVSALDSPDSSVESLFNVVWHRNATESQRLLAAIAILGKEDLQPNQALALVPVAPLVVRWEAVLRAVRLGVSASDLMEAARTVSAERRKDDLVHMICVAAGNSTDALFDWMEDGACVRDLIAVGRSGLGRVSVEAAEAAQLSESVTFLDMIDMLDEEFPQGVRKSAALWLRQHNGNHVGIIRHIQMKGL